MLHNVAVKRPNVTSIVARVDTISKEMADKRSIKETDDIRMLLSK